MRGVRPLHGMNARIGIYPSLTAIGIKERYLIIPRPKKTQAMTESSLSRRFTAEQSRRSLATLPPELSDGACGAEEARQRHCEVMEALAALHRQLAHLRLPEGTASATVAPVAAASESEAAPSKVDIPEGDELRAELRALQAAINDTRREIAALRQMGKPPAHLATATDELDAVVQATESATECILSSSERIDHLLGALRNRASADETAGIDEIGEQVTRIFESCNFQDITGQRITKVVNALKFVEARVDRMIEVLGGDDVIEEVEQQVVAGASDAQVDDESHLLCGPQLDQHKISQDDIDRFFS